MTGISYVYLHVDDLIDSFPRLMTQEKSVPISGHKLESLDKQCKEVEVPRGPKKAKTRIISKALQSERTFDK